MKDNNKSLKFSIDTEVVDNLGILTVKLSILTYSYFNNGTIDIKDFINQIQNQYFSNNIF